MRTIAATDGAWKDKAAVEKAEQCAAFIDNYAAANRKPQDLDKRNEDGTSAFQVDVTATWGHRVATLLKQAGSRATGVRKTAADELIRMGQIADRIGRGEISRPS